ncbi:UBP-type zinc finger domain-containing protein [Streptacidiphilus sp. P02-A3a]|uniref:UBP-type zinc finger domain-containing protein n=1 Tax=Streptacidiphilus sp. P02-A3a TaxID=2704468 RepID=UPI0015FA72C3|nr:UBP-type zinc finger domain-containing protein [Streptacidiphilus sp. P02-A3a]QMU71657.1 UBP-type zinc finger domain-containing protein [Streptacidiphilus sp. P02-A3a]
MTEPLPWHAVRPPGAARDRPCSHLAQARPPLAELPRPATPAGCAECLASGGQWVNRLVCLTCGHVGCCDSSPGQHAYAHARASPGHELARTLKSGEDWAWCYTDEVFLAPGPPPG